MAAIPFGALAVSDERSVSARLETLESSISKVTNAVEKMAANLASPQDSSVFQTRVSSFPALKNPTLVVQLGLGLS